MAEFAEVSKARASYKTFSEAMSAGREILKRAGVPDPPPIPDFDVVYRRLDAASKEELFAQLPAGDLPAQEAIRIWTPFVKRAFTRP